MSIQSEINRIKNDKETLITNLEAIGIVIEDGAKLSEISTNVTESDALDTSDATVTADEILSGETAYAKGNKVTGTMPNNGAVSKTMDGINTKSVSIPKGYTSGGTVSLDNTIDNIADTQEDLMVQIQEVLADKVAPSGGTDTSDATAAASDIMLNKTAYARGSKVTGTFTIDEELTEQNELISQIITLVNQKANPSSGNTLETCTVTITDNSSGGLGSTSIKAAAICHPVEGDYYFPLYEIETPITITVVKNSIICIYDTNSNSFSVEHSDNIESFLDEYNNAHLYRITGDASITTL